MRKYKYDWRARGDLSVYPPRTCESHDPMTHGFCKVHGRMITVKADGLMEVIHASGQVA